MSVVNVFSPSIISIPTVDAFVTTAHPFAVFFPGRTTTMSLIYTILSLRSDDDSIVWDGAAWMEPLAIFFRREEDRQALVELLSEYDYTFTQKSDVGTLIACLHS